MAAAAPIIASATVKGAIARVALSVAASFVVNKLFAPDVPNGGSPNAPSVPDQGVQQRLSTNTENKLPVVYGESRVFGSIWFADISSDNQTMAFIIPLCEGPIEAINDIYWDDWKLTLDGGGNVTNATDRDGQTDDFLNGNLQIIKYTNGGRCTNMENFSSKWNTNSAQRTMPNMAYLYAELNYDRDKSVTGLTNKLGAEVLGKKVRTITDANTINGTLTYSNNPAECTLDYLTNSVYGCGNIITDSDIDIESFYNHKVWCDELLDYEDNQGATQQAKRFTCNGFVNTNETRDIAISDLTMNSQSTLAYSLGKFQMISDKVSSSVMTFDTSNTYGDVAISNDGFNTTLNRIEVTYNSKLNLYQGDQVFVDLPESAKAPFEPELVKNLKAKFNNNAVEVKRWATTNINKSRNNLTVSFQTDLRALALQVGDVITVKNDTYGFDTNGKLFRITAISETQINGNLPGFTIAAREYAAADYDDLTLVEEDTAANTSLPNPRKFGLITDLTSTLSSSSGATPFIDLTFTVPEGIIEEFELFLSEGISGEKVSLPNITTPTGTFTTGNLFTHRVLNLEFTSEDLYFFVKPINKFAKGELSNSYNFGPFVATTSSGLTLENGIFTDSENPEFPFGTQNKHLQIVYGDDINGSNIRKNPGQSTYEATLNYTGTNVETVTRTGGTTTSGTVTFDPSFESGLGTNQIEEIELTEGTANVLSNELAHISVADNQPNVDSIQAVTGVKSYGLSGFINTDPGSNSAKVNDDVELYSLLDTTPSNFGSKASIGNKVAYVGNGTNIYAFYEDDSVNGNWYYNNVSITNSDNFISDVESNKMVTYNQGNSTAEIRDESLLALATLTGVDLTVDEIIDFKDNILVWYNGTDIKIIKVDYLDDKLNYSRDILTVANVRTIKIVNEYEIEYTTDTDVNKVAFNEAANTNIYNLNTGANIIGAAPNSTQYFPIDGRIINSFGNQIVIRGSDPDVDLNGFGTSGTLAIIPENDYAQYGAQAVSYINAPTRVTSAHTINTAIEISGSTCLNGVISTQNTVTEMVVEHLRYKYGTKANGWEADIPDIPLQGEVQLNNDGVWRAYDNRPESLGGSQSILYVGQETLPVDRGERRRWSSSNAVPVNGDSFYPLLHIRGDYVFHNITFNTTYPQQCPIKVRATSAPIEVLPGDIIITVDTNNSYNWNIGDQGIAVYTDTTEEDPANVFVHSYDYAIEAKFTNISAQPTQSWKVKSVNNSLYFKHNNTFAYQHSRSPYGDFEILTGAVIGEDKLSTDLLTDLFDEDYHIGVSKYYHSGVPRSFLTDDLGVEIMTIELADGTEQVVTGDITYTCNVLSRDDGTITPRRGLGVVQFPMGSVIADTVRSASATINALPGHQVYETNPANTTIKYVYEPTEAVEQLDIDGNSNNSFTSYNGGNPWQNTNYVGGLSTTNNNSNFHRTGRDSFVVSEGSDIKAYKWDTNIVAQGPSTPLTDNSGEPLIIAMDPNQSDPPNINRAERGYWLSMKRADGGNISGITGSADAGTRLANAADFLISKGIGINYSYYINPTNTLTEANGGKWFTINSDQNQPAFIEQMNFATGDATGVTEIGVQIYNSVAASGIKQGAYKHTAGHAIERLDTIVTQVPNQTRPLNDDSGSQLALNFTGSSTAGVSLERADGNPIEFPGWDTGTNADKINAAEDYVYGQIRYLHLDLSGTANTQINPFSSGAAAVRPGGYVNGGTNSNLYVQFNGSNEIISIWCATGSAGGTSPTNGTDYDANIMYTGHSLFAGTALEDDSGEPLLIQSSDSDGHTIIVRRADNAAISGIQVPTSNDSNARREYSMNWLHSKGFGSLESTVSVPPQAGKYLTVNDDNDMAHIAYISAAQRVSSGNQAVREFTLVLRNNNNLTKEGNYVHEQNHNIKRVDGDVIRSETYPDGVDNGGNTLEITKASALDDDSNNDYKLTAISRRDGNALDFPGWNTGTFADKIQALGTWHDNNLKYQIGYASANDGSGNPDIVVGFGQLTGIGVNGNHASWSPYIPSGYFHDAVDDRIWVKTTTGNNTGDITHYLIQTEDFGKGYSYQGVTGTSYDLTIETHSHTIEAGLLPPAYAVDETYTGAGGEIKGWLTHFTSNGNLYSYLKDKATASKVFDPTSENYSLTIGSNVIATNENFVATDNLAAINEIRTKILAETNYYVSQPYRVNKIDNTQTDADAIGGYAIDVDLGSDPSTPFTFSISNTGADEFNSYVTDDDITATQATLTTPDGTNTIFSLSSSHEGDNKADELGILIQDYVNNTYEGPEDYTASYDTATDKITFTANNPFHYNASNIWGLSISHPGTTPNGTLTNEATNVTVQGVDNSHFTITHSTPSYLPNLGLVSQNKIEYGAEFTDANTAASEFATAFNNFVGANGTANAASNVVTFSINVEADVGLSFDFSDNTPSTQITESITQGSLGATIDGNTGSNLEITKPDASVENLKFFYLSPTVPGGITNVGEIISSISDQLTDYTFTDNTGSITITRNDNTPVNGEFGFVWTHDGGVTDPIDFDEESAMTTNSNFGNELNENSGHDYPTHYGIRSPFSDESFTTFPLSAASYKWYEIDAKVNDFTGEINPQYRIQTATRPQFRFDRNAQSDNFANIDTVNAGVIAPNVIDTDVLTVQQVYGREVVQPDADPLAGAQLTFWKGKYYLALAVDDALYSTININNNQGEAIYTLEACTNHPGEFYNWNGSALVQENDSKSRTVYVFDDTLNAFVEIYE